MTIIAPDRFESMSEGAGEPTQRQAEWMEAITRQMNLSTILRGTGTPEGGVSANPTQLYMDDTGSAGNILYIKQTGTGNTGWILV